MNARILSSCLAAVSLLACGWMYWALQSEREYAALLAMRVADLEHDLFTLARPTQSPVEPAMRSAVTDTYYTELRAQKKRRLADTYFDLGKALHLSTAEVDQVLDIVADFETRAMEAASEENESVEPLDRDAAREQIARYRTLSDAALKQILGDAKLKQWHDYASARRT